MMAQREPSAQIDADAADWAVRIDHAPLGEEDQAALDAWLGADIRRRGAFARAQAMLLHAQRAKALGASFDPDAYLAAHGEPAIPVTTGVQPDRRSILRWGGSAAAAAAVAACFAWLGVHGSAQAYATRRGEVRLVPLDDGSQMTLNTATSAEVRFSEGERRVDLASGEALFDVAKDTARPFVVVVGDMAIRAVGTSFTVRLLAGQPVQVLVREGVVELRPRSGGGAKTLISANSRAVAASDVAVAISGVPPAEVNRALAWREGMLSFEDTSLAAAASEFARFSERRILFADAAIGNETIAGVYSAHDPRGFARSAALSLGLEVRETPDAIVLTR